MKNARVVLAMLLMGSSLVYAKKGKRIDRQAGYDEKVRGAEVRSDGAEAREASADLDRWKSALCALRKKQNERKPVVEKK